MNHLFDISSSQGTSIDANNIHSTISGKSNDPDLPLKYNKLLAEFSKVRNQLNAVTKAWTDELKNKKTLNEQVEESNKLIGILQTEILSLKSREKTCNSSGDGSSSRFFLPLEPDELNDQTDALNELKKQIDSLSKSNEQLTKTRLDNDLIIQSQEEIIEEQRMMINTLTEKQAREENVTINFEPEEKETWLWKRNQELTNLLEMANSKLILFSDECLRLKERLSIANDSKKVAQEEILECRNLIQSLNDELNTSVRNYESQLEAMSDHLATMNEKWSKTEIEMDSLKRQAGSNGKQVSRQSSR